ncbi:MAG: hypothetical protein IT200_06440 [Thermoleophilia bacterium]|nr:hypothetical protein [Thermoleophilia bacterium]
MDSPAGRRAAWIAGIVLIVLAVAAAPGVAVLWPDEYATFEDSVLGAALVCVPVLAVGIGLWVWGRRSAADGARGTPRIAALALGLAVAAVAAPWVGALVAWEEGGFFIGVAATVVLSAGGAVAGAIARGRSPHGSPGRRRATAAMWLAALGFAATLAVAALVVIWIVSTLE